MNQYKAFNYQTSISVLPSISITLTVSCTFFSPRSTLNRPLDVLLYCEMTEYRFKTKYSSIIF